jgi:methionine-rich copper-binding protein CopC
MNNLVSRSGRWHTRVVRSRIATIDPRRAAVIVLAILVGVIALQVAGAGPATAHARLVSSSPAKGATLNRLPQVAELKFSEVVGQPAALVVTGPDGNVISTGKAAVVDAILSRPLDTTRQAAGAYTMSYQVTSVDGHPISGTVTFTLSTGQVTPAPVPTVDRGIPAAPDIALVSSSPGKGAALNRLPEVAVLNFKEVVGQPAALVVTGPDGDEISTGEASVVDATLLRPMDSTAELAAGTYTMSYRVTSADGHPISGAVTFTLPTGQVATSADPVFGDSPVSGAVAAPAVGDDSGDGSGIVVALVVGLAAALGVAVVSLGRMVGRETGI